MDVGAWRATVHGVVKSRTRLSVHSTTTLSSGFPGGASGKEPARQCSRYKRHGFDPWVRSMPWRRKWQNPLQYSCLGNPMDRGTWRVTVWGMAKSQIRLKRLSTELSEYCSIPNGWRSLNCDSPRFCCPDRHFHSHFERDCERKPDLAEPRVPSMVCVLPDGRSQVTFFLKQPWDSREAGDFSDKSSAIEVGASTPGPQWEKETLFQTVLRALVDHCIVWQQVLKRARIFWLIKE